MWDNNKFYNDTPRLMLLRDGFTLLSELVHGWSLANEVVLVHDDPEQAEDGKSN